MKKKIKNIFIACALVFAACAALAEPTALPFADAVKALLIVKGAALVVGGFAVWLASKENNL